MTQSYVEVLFTQRPDDVPVLKARIAGTPAVKEVIELLARAAREFGDLERLSLTSSRGVDPCNDLDLRRISLLAKPGSPAHDPLSLFTGDQALDGD